MQLVITVLLHGTWGVPGRRRACGRHGRRSPPTPGNAQRIERAHFTQESPSTLRRRLWCIGTRTWKGRVASPANALGIGVDEELVRVEPQAVMRSHVRRRGNPYCRRPCLVEMEVPQAIVRAGHLEQCLAQAEQARCASRSGNGACSRGAVRCVIGRNRLVVERARLSTGSSTLNTVVPRSQNVPRRPRRRHRCRRSLVAWRIAVISVTA